MPTEICLFLLNSRQIFCRCTSQNTAIGASPAQHQIYGRSAAFQRINKQQYPDCQTEPLVFRRLFPILSSTSVCFSCNSNSSVSMSGFAYHSPCKSSINFSPDIVSLSSKLLQCAPARPHSPAPSSRLSHNILP
jgi:hypothetical protein